MPSRRHDFLMSPCDKCAYGVTETCQVRIKTRSVSLLKGSDLVDSLCNEVTEKSMIEAVMCILVMT